MKCFYHNDLDGRCAGSIVAQFESNHNPDDFIEVDYIMDLPLDDICECETVYFVDYSFKENTKWVLDKLIEMQCDVIWIDHHTSSLNLIKQYPELDSIRGLRSDEHSGAALTYMFLHECDYKKVPTYVSYVSDYDCWKFQYEPSTSYFKLGIETTNYDALDKIWYWLYEESADNGSKKLALVELSKLIDIGETVKQFIDMDNKQYRDSYAYESEIDGHKCIVVNKKTNSWVFGEKYSEYPVCMIWVFNGDKYSYSIYSGDKNIDCSKIAEKYGGGGHKGAAGFSSDVLLFRKN